MSKSVHISRTTTVWGATCLLATGIMSEAAPLLVFTATNLWVLMGSYLTWAADCSRANGRIEVRSRITKYAVCVLGLSLAAVIKGHAPTATRMGLTESVLAVGATIQGAICVVLVYWASLRRESQGDAK